MLAVLVNVASVVAGSLIGIALKNRLSESLQNAVMTALGLCTVLIGVQTALKTQDILCVILCMALGTLIGELCRIDDGIESVGSRLKSTFLSGKGGSGRFAEGFMSASILFCVGSMTIMGSLEAGINGNYSIIYAKSALDFVSSIAFGAAMGIGVTFSGLFVLVFQGGLTLLAGLVGAALSAEVVNEMSAVGGTVIIGLAVNMLGLRSERIKVANMLPAVFLPLLYVPLAAWIGSL